MTDPKPAKAAPAKPAAAKAAPAKAAVAKTPATKAPAAAAKTPARTTAATKAAPATRAKAPAKTTAAAATSVVPPVPVVAPPVPVAAAAPAGWYQVGPGSPQQRYWDGAAWTEHIHDPATVQVPTAQGQIAAAHQNHLTAPEGTNPNTVWIWLTIASLVIGIAASLFQLPVIAGNSTSVNGAVDSGAPFLVSTLLSLVELVAYVLFAVLDWRALGKRGVPRPFHWAWSLFAIILSSPIVYVIGRTVVVKRRTGKGLAPLWVFIALQIVTWIFGLVILVVVLTALATQFGNLLSGAGNVL